MLQLNHIKKSYDKKEVLSDVNYTFEDGKVYSLLAAAGAGRTTLFECICSDLTIDDGNIVTENKTFYLQQNKVFFPCLFQEKNLFM